jgi:predicted porin
MKKSLLALAALTAFAGAASAQSSVTLFGVVDLAGTYIDNDVDGKYLLAQDGNASSRIGFRGVEDLGGGLRAGFWLEGAISPDNGGTSLNFQRRSTVSLISGWGELRLGRDYTPTFWNWTSFDPFGTNGVGASTNLALNVDQVPGATYNTLVRANNSIGYFLPAMGGLYGQVMVAAGEGETTAANKMFGGRIGWAAGPFDVAVAYSTTEAPAGFDVDNFNVAGSWNFGFMKLAAFYSQIEADGNRFDQENWFVGATVPMGAWTFKGTWGSADRSAGPAATASTPLAFSSGNADQLAIGFTYDLSKRTALYGTYSQISNDDGAKYRVFGASNALTQGANNDSMGYQFGVRHSF